MKRLSVLFLLVLSAGCSTQTSSNSDDIKIPKTTKILDAETRQALSSYSADSVEFSHSTAILDSLATGDVIVTTHAPPLAPDGFLRQVLAITRSSGHVTLSTGPAGLTRAIEQGSVYLAQPITWAQVDSSQTKTMPGVSIETMSGPLSSSSIAPGHGMRLNFDHLALGGPPDPLTITGHIIIDPFMVFHLDVRNFAVNSYEFSVTLNNDTDIQVSGHLESGDHIKHEFGPLFNTILFAIDIQVGPFPLVVVVALELKIGFKATGALSSSSMHVVNSSSSTAGTRYDASSGWANLGSGMATGALDYSPDTTYSLVLDLYPHMETQLRFYDVLGPYVYHNTGVQLDLANLRHPFLHAGVHVELGAGVKIEIIDDIAMGATAFLESLANFFDFSRALYDQVFNFYDSPNFPPAVSITSPLNGALFGPADTLTFAASASDIEDGLAAGGNLRVIWSSDIDGALGEGATLPPIDQRTLFAHGPGVRTITATAWDTDRGMTTSQITINLTAPPLSASITHPLASTTIWVDHEFAVSGALNDPFSPGVNVCTLPGYTFTWSSSDPADVFSAPHGCPWSRLTPSTATARTLTFSATAPYGRTASATRVVTPIVGQPADFSDFVINSPSGSVYNHGGANPDITVSATLGPQPVPPVTYVWTATSYTADGTLHHDKVVIPKTTNVLSFLWTPSAIAGFVIPGGDTLIELDVQATDSKAATGNASFSFHYYE